MGGKSVAGVFRPISDFQKRRQPSAAGIVRHRAQEAGPSGTEAWFGLLVPGVSRPSTARRDREHGETEPNHHHSDEFESKGVHGNSPAINR